MLELLLLNTFFDLNDLIGLLTSCESVSKLVKVLHKSLMFANGLMDVGAMLFMSS